MEFRGIAASTSTSHFPASALESDDDAPPLPFPSRTGGAHRHFPLSRDDEEFRRRFGETDNYGGGGETPRSDNAWSGIVTFITFWCFVSMSLIFGVYGTEIFKLRPHDSILIKPNPLFVDYVKVERISGGVNELMLYGFDGTPALNVATNWSESHKVILPGATHKEWMYYLNIGSKIDISYNVTSLLPSPVVLVIAEGNQGLIDWLEDPSSNSTLLWNPIYGSGAIGLDIPKSAGYYIAVGNLNSVTVEVELQIRIKALLYDTTNAYYKCTISIGTCILKIPFIGRNSAVLAFSSPELAVGYGKSHVQLSYGPRWIMYLGGIGGVIVLVSLAIRCSNKFRRTSQGERSPQENMEPQGAPLIPRKDDDVESLDSSYDSFSQDGDDHDDRPSSSSHNGNDATDHEHDNNTRRLCAICFDAPRDCFFLPCGHCVSCYACGTKIAEVARTCPICRKPMKKVKKIYTV